MSRWSLFGLVWFLGFFGFFYRVADGYVCFYTFFLVFFKRLAHFKRRGMVKLLSEVFR